MCVIKGEELKCIELEILKYIRNVCEENDLHYFLAYGTLLGAFRHQGFIPWDDDIDIWMPRIDYEKFIQIESQKQGRYQLFSFKNKKDYYYEISKVIDTKTNLVEIGFLPIKDYGVYVDIFPLDGVPNKFIRVLLQCMFYAKTASVNISPKLNIKHEKKAKLFRFIGWVFTFLGARTYPKLMDFIAKMYKIEKCKYVGCSVRNMKDNVFPKKIFEHFVKVNFEGDCFNAPIGYDNCLKILYGKNYMTLPPLEMRKSVHKFIAYYKK